MCVCVFVLFFFPSWPTCAASPVGQVGLDGEQSRKRWVGSEEKKGGRAARWFNPAKDNSVGGGRTDGRTDGVCTQNQSILCSDEVRI